MKTETAYAVTKTAVNFLDSRNCENSTTSRPLVNQTTAFDISQRQSGMIQDTPTPDATVISAQKEKAVQDAIAAKNANDWWRTNLIPLVTSVAGLSGLAAIVVGIWQYNSNQRIDREKREEDQFRSAVSDLVKDDTKVGAANMLLTFLQEGKSYEKFYRQCFDLSVAYLQNREVKPDVPMDSFTQSMTKVFIRSYMLERDRLKKLTPGTAYDPKVLDASGVKLDGADLNKVDLADAWMPDSTFNNAKLYKAQLDRANLESAFFRKAELLQASLQNAHLRNSDFTSAQLIEANLEGINLGKAIFQNANLSKANLSRVTWQNKQMIEMIKPDIQRGDLLRLMGLGEEIVQEVISSNAKFQHATLIQANLAMAKLHGADFSEAVLIGANLSGANLKSANLTKADLTRADVTGSTIEWADVKDADMIEVIGLTEEQRHICETIKHANFTPLTLDPTTAAYIQQIFGGIMDQLRDYL